jgi:hypothetical protein
MTRRLGTKEERKMVANKENFREMQEEDMLRAFFSEYCRRRN